MYSLFPHIVLSPSAENGLLEISLWLFCGTERNGTLFKRAILRKKSRWKCISSSVEVINAIYFVK